MSGLTAGIQLPDVDLVLEHQRKLILMMVEMVWIFFCGWRRWSDHESNTRFYTNFFDVDDEF